jgi:hypothetical protein
MHKSLQDDVRSEVTTKHYTSFEGRVRSCAGAECMKLLIITVFLHVLLTYHGYLSSSCLFKYFGMSRAKESDINKFGHCKEEKHLLPSPLLTAARRRKRDQQDDEKLL